MLTDMCIYHPQLKCVKKISFLQSEWLLKGWFWVEVAWAHDESKEYGEHRGHETRPEECLIHV